MSALGAVESNGAVTFGLWLPWVSAGDGNAVTVKIIHEADQFLAGVPAREFPLTHSVRPPYGDFWSTTVPIAGTAPSAPGSAWGTPGRYVYRYTIVNPNVGTLDWIIDPFAREFGVGKLSAFTLGYQAYQWSVRTSLLHCFRRRRARPWATDSEPSPIKPSIGASGTGPDRYESAGR